MPGNDGIDLLMGKEKGLGFYFRAGPFNVMNFTGDFRVNPKFFYCITYIVFSLTSVRSVSKFQFLPFVEYMMRDSIALCAK